jgi:hypothetical protein
LAGLPPLGSCSPALLHISVGLRLLLPLSFGGLSLGLPLPSLVPPLYTTIGIVSVSGGEQPPHADAHVVAQQSLAVREAEVTA